mgnify:CR=1 FL=1
MNIRLFSAFSVHNLLLAIDESFERIVEILSLSLSVLLYKLGILNESHTLIIMNRLLFFILIVTLCKLLFSE